MVDERTYPVVAFSEIDHSSFFDSLKKDMFSEIEEAGKDYLLKIDEHEYKSYLYKKFSLEPLKIHYDKLTVEKPDHTFRSLEELRNKVLKKLPKNYSFSLKLPFSGSESIFRIKPSNWLIVEETRIKIYKQEGIVSTLVTVTDTDSELFEREKKTALKQAFGNLDNANSDVLKWNAALPNLVDQYFHSFKNAFLKENKFYEEIKLRVNNETDSIFSVPTIKKIEIPRPNESNKKTFTSEPTLSNEVYQDILKVIYTAGKSMEKKPSLYENKDEESLRDLFVFLLETRYEATTATGETFNKNGKTDIILKYEDGTNLFVAECKFWKGESEYLDAISQLVDRYLTWRDSKVALMMFVKNKGMQGVIETTKLTTSKHPYYLLENGSHGETSFSYIFRLPQDPEKNVMLEVLLFHYSS